MRPPSDKASAPPARRGRPPAGQRGLVEERVLDAATTVFLREGFARASLEQIAEVARTGKATLYARYSSKHELFTAVVRRCVSRALGRIRLCSETNDRNARLIAFGTMLATETLTPEVVALMRMTIAEAGHFPELTRQAHRIGFGDTVEEVARQIAAVGKPSATAMADAMPVATRFVELAITPLQMRALFGEDLEELRRRAPTDIAAVVSILDTLLARPPD